MMYKFGVLCLLLICLSGCESADTWDKIKAGAGIAYDEVHCQFHKLKELIKHHEHDVDPCAHKTATSTANPKLDYENLEQRSPNYGREDYESVGITDAYNNHNNNNGPSSPRPYGWQP